MWEAKGTKVGREKGKAKYAVLNRDTLEDDCTPVVAISSIKLVAKPANPSIELGGLTWLLWILLLTGHFPITTKCNFYFYLYFL